MQEVFIMRRTITIILAISLIFAFCVSSALAQNIDAPEVYQNTWTSRIGGTTIYLNATVEVPDAETFPVVSVRPTDITADQVQAMADIVFAQEGYIGTSSFSVPKGEEHFKISSTDLMESKREVNGYPDAYLDAFNSYFYDRLSASSLRYWHTQNPDDYWYSTTTMHLDELNGESIPNSAYDYTAAFQLALSVQQAVAPDLTSVACGSIQGDIYSQNESDLDIAPVHAYSFVFTRSVEGIPETYEYTRVGDVDPSEIMSVPVDYERLTVVISDRGIYAVEYNNPHIVLGVLDENPELLSFNQVIDIAKSISPLQYAYFESDFAHVHIYIDRITLGYMRVRNWNDPTQYQLIPVWDFFGYAQYEDESGQISGQQTAYISQLTINALDGTVIDRSYGY